MRYFAYGSNMFENRLRQRNVAARCLGTATLPGYVLSFTKRGLDGSGKCTIVPAGTQDDLVYGVLFEIDPRHIHRLDAVEQGYRRQKVLVLNGSRREGHVAETYVAPRETLDSSAKPYGWYKALVIAGALEHGLAHDYIAFLARCPSVTDDDPSRRNAARAILGGVQSC